MKRILTALLVVFASISVQAATGRVQAYVYSVDEVAGLTTGARWTGGRYIPFLVGDDPRNFAPLPRGAKLQVSGNLGGIPGQNFQTYSVAASSTPGSWFIFVTGSGAGFVIECRLNYQGLVYFKSHEHNAWKILVHGEYQGSKDLQMILEPCAIDGMMDLHGELIPRDVKAIPALGFEAELLARTWPVQADKVVPPKIAYRVNPQYTEEARLNKWQGSVTIHVTVGTDGQARDIKIVRQLGMGLDEQAIAAVRQWRFEPATKSGVAVPFETTLEVNFRLY